MRTLPSQFSFDGCEFRQLARRGNVVLLERTKLGHRSPTYEVAIVQHHPATTIHGRHYDARESMPPTAAWGTQGWSYTTLANASQRFDDLVNRLTESIPSPTPFPAGASKHRLPA